MTQKVSASKPTGDEKKARRCARKEKKLDSRNNLARTLDEDDDSSGDENEEEDVEVENVDIFQHIMTNQENIWDQRKSILNTEVQIQYAELLSLVEKKYNLGPEPADTVSEKERADYTKKKKAYEEELESLRTEKAKAEYLVSRMVLTFDGEAKNIDYFYNPFTKQHTQANRSWREKVSTQSIIYIYIYIYTSFL